MKTHPRAFKNFLSNLGFACRQERLQTNGRLCWKRAKEPAPDIINRVALRCLKKARYTPENAGHFGLRHRALTAILLLRSGAIRFGGRVITDYIEGTMDYQRLEQLEKELVPAGSATPQ